MAHIAVCKKLLHFTALMKIKYIDSAAVILLGHGNGVAPKKEYAPVSQPQKIRCGERCMEGRSLPLGPGFSAVL